MDLGHEPTHSLSSDEEGIKGALVFTIIRNPRESNIIVSLLNLPLFAWEPRSRGGKYSQIVTDEECLGATCK